MQLYFFRALPNQPTLIDAKANKFKGYNYFHKEELDSSA